MTNPFYDPYQILSKVYAEGAHLKIALAETPIEESRRAATVKTVYGVLENDGYFTHCIRTFAPKNPKQSARILLKIALYWIVVLKKSRFMVTDTAVDLCKRLGKGGMSGFLNAFLRAFDESAVSVPEGIEGLCMRSNFPRFAVEKIVAQYGARAENILLAKSRGVSVRFAQGREREYVSLPHTETPFHGVYLFERFRRDGGFDDGKYTFQSVGSVAICSIVAPCRKLLDACAAPGGKSVLLSETCEEVTACELHPHRVSLIRSYCERMGARNVTALQADSAQFRPEFENAFDGVLCDVPCSGLGTVAENPDLPLRKKEEDLAQLLETQRAILENCSRYVKAGGALYYSTCSILKEENNGVVGAFLKAHPSFFAEKVDCPLAHDRTEFGLQFLPDTAYGAGFYVCKLKNNVRI